MLVFLGGTPTWWFHTRLCKFVQNISTNICSLGRRAQLKLWKVSYLFISNNMISWHYCVSIAWQCNQRIGRAKAKPGAHGLLDTVNFGTALTWTLVFSLWREFTPTWNQSKCRIPNTIQWKKLRKCDVTEDKKEDFSKSFRPVRFPKLQIFVEMFRRNLQSPVWKRHIGGCTSVVRQYGDREIVLIFGTYFGFLGDWLLSVLKKIQVFTKQFS